MSSSSLSSSSLSPQPPPPTTTISSSTTTTTKVKSKKTKNVLDYLIIIDKDLYENEQFIQSINEVCVLIFFYLNSYIEFLSFVL